MDELTPLARHLVDTAFDGLDVAARERGETPRFQHDDVRAAVAAVLRELVIHRGGEDHVHLVDELAGKPVPAWWLDRERARGEPRTITTAGGNTYPLVSTPGATAHKDGVLIYENGRFIDEER